MTNLESIFLRPERIHFLPSLIVGRTTASKTRGRRRVLTNRPVGGLCCLASLGLLFGWALLGSPIERGRGKPNTIRIHTRTLCPSTSLSKSTTPTPVTVPSCHWTSFSCVSWYTPRLLPCEVTVGPTLKLPPPATERIHNSPQSLFPI
jgi:hypothetical protein